MSAACRAFRERLASALSGSPQLTELSWHEHLLACSDCRALLDSEEALEELLASLPAPHLPADLNERVLARLARVRETGLDQLLDLDHSPDAPAGLSERVLEGVSRARARRVK